VVVGFMLFMVARTLSSAPAPSLPVQRVDPAKTDLSAYTRMVGSPGIDSLLRRSLPETTAARLVQIEKMVEDRELRDAVGRMQRMLSREKLSAAEQALLRGYSAVCEHELANPNGALVNLLAGLALADAADSVVNGSVRAWLGFQAGWLFQYHGLADSARRYYEAALSAANAESPLRPTLLNNLGVALEAAGDSLAAAEAYRAAVALVDTTAQDRDPTRVRDNYRRVSARFRGDRP